MKKKGFTLIEIIVCIIILAIIGVSSFVGIKTLTKNIRIDKLEQITDRALQAAEVYIETNKESFNQLYNKKNSVVVPLNTLINEGLLDLKGTTLEDKDIENEYVITAFTGNNPKENCIDITSNASWNLSKDNPFYICSNEDGTSNSIIIGGTTNNADVVQKTRINLAPDRNYATYKGKSYRIMYIEYDDSIMLYTPEDTFGDSFKDITQKTKYEYFSTEESVFNGYSDGHYPILMSKEYLSLSPYKTYSIEEFNTIAANSLGELNKYDFYYRLCNENEDSNRTYILNKAICELKYEINSSGNHLGLYRVYTPNDNNEVPVSNLEDQSFPFIDNISLYSFGTWLDNKGKIRMDDEFNFGCVKGKKVNLKPCIKISGGIGTNYNPYVLDDSSC